MTVFSIPSFRNQTLWQQAMTHRSFANEQPTISKHNERLEFLGDAILTFVSGAYLYARYPNSSEGDLTPLRAALVNQLQLCHFAQKLGLDSHLRLGKGVNKEGGKISPRLLCSAFEALIGAYFLDARHNVQAVSDYVVPMFDAVIEQAVKQGINPKSRLQEWAHKVIGTTPGHMVECVIVNTSGPDHAKTFTVEVRIAGKVYGRGKGRSKGEAEQAAAAIALTSLGNAFNDSDDLNARSPNPS